MGSCCSLELADYPIVQTKSYPIPELMALFKERDRKVFERKISDRNPTVWGSIDDDGSTEKAFTYSLSIEHLKDRLHLLGFTLDKTRDDFERCKREEIERLKELSERSEEEPWSEQQSSLESASFEDFLNAFQVIRKRRVLPEISLSGLSDDELPLLRYMLAEHDNYPCSDIRFLIRAFLETCPPSSVATYELTEIVHAGYYREDDPIADLACQALIGEHPRNGKIIILTEGKTDSEILRRSLVLLYPHLADFFSFFDFERSNLQGGTGSLATSVKSFAGAGIINRTLAIFDNDTAASEAIRGLSRTTIPENIHLMRLPDIDVARAYPTLGTIGLSIMDVNGLACSIELYLGKDVLEEDGKLLPVQWIGYSDSEAQYQGSLIDKNLVQKRFFEKLARCEANPREIENTDWSSLRRVFAHIFIAFSS